MKRFICLFLTFSMLFSLCATSFATELDTQKKTEAGDIDIPLVIDVEGTSFNVTVPSALPVHVATNGEVTVATNAAIKNNSAASIQVTNVDFEIVDGWTLSSYDDDFSVKSLNAKEFGFMINDANVASSDFNDELFGIVGPNTELPVIYDMKIAPQTNGFDGNMAYIVFTVNWATEPINYEIKNISELDTYEDADGNVSLVLDNGQSADLSAVATYSTETPTWKSSDESVITISDEGVMTAHAPGYAEITYGISRVSETIGVWVPCNTTFTVTEENRSLVGYAGTENEELVISKYVMDNEQLQKVTSIGNSAFDSCENLISVVIPDSVTSIGNYAFAYCENLTNIEIPDNITRIGWWAFSETPWLTAKQQENPLVIVGNGVLINGTICSGDIVIPESVTSISNGAFVSCENLTSIEIPDSVNSIGERALYGCSNLTEISYTGTIYQWNAITKETDWDTNTGTYTVHCNDGDIAKS